ncbi:hypothetical protein ACFYXF_11945 [Streptomyces sp. NPDC002680]|uniref:hypothetical protein n=1 Tax=Streptomyces sp. NPDC002680 TaxID=3364659 RepID=UPI0036BD7D97
MTNFNPRGARNQGPGMSNKGVINLHGTMGDVQNTVDSVGTVQKQVRFVSDAGTADDWTRILGELDTALAGEPEGVTDPEGCRALLGLIRNQNVGEDAERDTARSRLQTIRTLCGDASVVLSLITSALALLGSPTG